MLENLRKASSALSAVAKMAATGLVERETLVDLILLSAVAGEHLLIIGPPGTAKSAAVRRVSQTLDGRYFEYLLGRFTEPSELFGPIDLRKLKEGVVETATEGMLPEAELVFLDEVFLGSTAVLNTLLGVLNERKFRRGHTVVQCPLQLCVAASNHLPEDESLAAFADRFLVRYFVEPVPDSQLESLLIQGWKSDHAAPKPSLNMAQLGKLTEVASKLNLKPIVSDLADCIRRLRAENINLSDRRIVKSQRLIAAATVLDGRLQPTKADLWPLLHVITGKEDQITAQEILKDHLAESQSTTLSAAAENASQGPLARAHRLTLKATELIEKQESQEGRNPLALEAIGREIDASFGPNNMPEPLKIAREKLITILSTVE